MKSLESEGNVVKGHTPIDRSICTLGIDVPRVELLPKRVKYTRVYTVVYQRVYNCVHTCTQPRSMYILCRAHSYVHSSGLRPRHKRYGQYDLGHEIKFLKSQREENTERDHTSTLRKRPISKAIRRGFRILAGESLCHRAIKARTSK